jgi:hypothetical protein
MRPSFFLSKTGWRFFDSLNAGHQRPGNSGAQRRC